MEQTQAPRPEKRKNAFNNPKLKLAAPNPNKNVTVWSTLGFDFYQNNPRLVMDTKDPSLSGKENGYGRLTAALDLPAFMIFLEHLETCIRSKEAIEFKIENFNHEYVDGRRSAEITHLTDLRVGRDAQGQIYVMVTSAKGAPWPEIKFVFGPADNRYNKFGKADGTPMSRAEVSVVAAKGYLRLLNGLIPAIANTHYYEAPPNPNWKPGGNKQYGGGGGGYNRNGGGNYNRAPAAPAAPANATDDFANDIPW